MKALFISLSFGVPAGYAPTVWEHPTRGMAHFERDRSECPWQTTHDETAIHPHGGASIFIPERVQECLRRRGYVSVNAKYGMNATRDPMK